MENCLILKVLHHNVFLFILVSFNNLTCQSLPSFVFVFMHLFSSIFIKVNFFFGYCYCIYLLVIDLTSYLLVQSIISIYHTQLRSVCDTMATVLSKFIISIFFNFPNNNMCTVFIPDTTKKPTIRVAMGFDAAMKGAICNLTPT